MKLQTTVPKMAYTVNEAAAMLGMSLSGVYKMISENRLPAIRLGARCIRIPKQALDRLLYIDAQPGMEDYKNASEQ